MVLCVCCRREGDIFKVYPLRKRNKVKYEIRLKYGVSGFPIDVAMRKPTVELRRRHPVTTLAYPRHKDLQRPHRTSPISGDGPSRMM